MALITLNFYSQSLGMQTEVLVIMPQKNTAGQIGIQSKAEGTAYPCLYLLHGLSDDHTIWLRRTSIERYASQYGICVVMPCGGRSFYSNTAYGMNYYDYIAKELPQRMQEFFHVSSRREDTFIAGLSMGGYGAFKIALREKNRFCAAAALSPVGDLQNAGFEGLLQTIFGSTTVPQEDDLLYLSKAHKDDPQKPKLYFAIGTDDFLYENSKSLRKTLTDCGYHLTYHEEKATHSWEFWDCQIQKVLQWMFDAR